MQISFDPLNTKERDAVTLLLKRVYAMDPDAAPEVEADTGEERSAADVFQSAAPLSAVQLGAGATPLPTALAALPVSSAPMQPATLPPASAGLASVAPTVPPAAPSSASGVELDVQGIPWDHRIHASTKTRNADGKWKKLKGLNDDAKYNAIVAELKALHAMAAPAAAPAPVQQALPTMPPANPLSAPVLQQAQQALQHGLPTFPNAVHPGLVEPPVNPVVAAALAAVPPAPPPAADPGAAVNNFDSLMHRITPAIAAGILPQDILANACAARQLPGPIALVTRPDFVPQIYADLRAAYPAFA